MKTLYTPCTPEQATKQLYSLPAAFRASVVGGVFARIIELLGGDGKVDLKTVTQALYPELSVEKARSVLSTQVANRAYKDAAGLQPLKLCISRKSKFTTEQAVWFEALAISVPSDAPIDTPRYEAANFAGGEAQAVSSQDINKALNESVKTALSASQLTPDKMDLNKGRANPIHGLREQLGTGTTRGESTSEAFVNTEAQAGIGFEAIGKKVTCLNAMLDWACDASPKAPRLLALLGDYGTGKTSHGMQLDRVVNGVVPFPQGIKPYERLPKPAFIDLALLAGVPNMAYLSLTEILTIALNKRRSGAGVDANTLIALARAGEVVMLYDGLDELLKQNEGHALHNLLDQLLRVLETDPSTGKPSKAKVMVSCRTHYFRDLQSTHAFFDTRSRGVAQVNDYLCLSLLPWNQVSIKEYLGKRLTPTEASALLDVIQTTYNLSELASKPVLLSMMCEQVGQLLREKDSGVPVTASRLYGITVSHCLMRDNGKHTIKPHHKPLLMGALATAMWNEGVEQWSANKLDGWLARAVIELFPNQYANINMGALQDDLRTATFIVRPSIASDAFNFSHRSFQEYFVARWVWDCANLQHDGLVDETLIRKYLPHRELNIETINFAHEMWQSIYNDVATQSIALRQSVYVWRWLQNTENSDLVIQRHTTIFKFILALDLAKKTIVSNGTELFEKYLIKNTSVNLKSIELIQERWEDLDFSMLPSIDFTGANLLCLRAWRCNFGRLLCEGGNWAQTVFRDCDMNGIGWGNADKGGMMIRYGERKPIFKALKGPWTSPWCLINAFVTGFDKSNNNACIQSLGENDAVYCDIFTGRTTTISENEKIFFKNLSSFDFQGKTYLRGSKKIPYIYISEKNVLKKYRLFEQNGYRLRNNHLGDLVKLIIKKNVKYLNIFKKDSLKTKIINGVLHASYYENKIYYCRVFTFSKNFEMDISSSALFDVNGNLLDYDDEAADTWLFCMASGRPEPVETALPVD